MKAANEGDAEAQYQLGLIYLYGNEEPKDARKAFEWMSRAAAQNVVPAMRELGIMLASGEGTEPDIPRAVQMLSDAADNLDPGALYHLGLMYEKGIGVRRASASRRTCRRRSGCSLTRHPWATPAPRSTLTG